MGRSKIKSAADIAKVAVLGQFEGECADANVTNENGLDILPEVWETVFASDIYKQALENRWYIGFLGHPDDPGDQNFQNACIVMTECHIEDNGKVYGTFDLVDTPVGRIVKSFIDAGVTFGISVRGAGDIIDNSVDPDTFVFRGFDLVTFPAYKEAIPTFTEIAASTDINEQKKYKAVCAAVRKNIEGLNTCAAVDIVQSQFAKQSEEYKMLQERKAEITSSTDLTITEEQLRGMTELYLKASAELKEAKRQVAILQSQLTSAQSIYTRKVRSIQRIMSAQTKDLQDEIFEMTNSYQVIKASNDRLKKENSQLGTKRSTLDDANAQLRKTNEQLRSSNSKLQVENNRLITASEKLNKEIATLKDRNQSLNDKNKSLNDSNLKYIHKIEATTEEMGKKDATISKLRSELNETVKSTKDLEARTSNRDATVRKLRQEISAANQLIQGYQDAYASLYANAVGTSVDNVTVTSSTSVEELKSMIGSISVNQKAASVLATTEIDDFIDSSEYDLDGLVTM